MIRKIIANAKAVLVGIGRDILRGMRCKYELQNRRVSCCHHFMADAFIHKPKP